MKVFWSWQSDTPGKTGRHFVRGALDTAITELKVEAEVEEPNARGARSALHLDQDRQGISGSPDLARVILEKVSEAVVFVADVTSVGIVQFVREDAAEKKLINANVAIELGYALGTIKDRALLMVMNEHYGSRDDLPFDLRAKAGPLTYRLAPDAAKEEIAIASRALVAQLKIAISLCLKNRVEEVRLATPFPAAVEKDGPARFRKHGEPIGNIWDKLPLAMGGSEAPVLLSEGPAMWLRLMPSSETGAPWPSHELREKANHFESGSFNLGLLYSDHRFPVRAGDGFGLCCLHSPDSPNPKATSLVFAFETGEIWSVDTDLLRFGVIPFIEATYVKRLSDYARFLKSLGIHPPYKWMCGMTGVKGHTLEMPSGSGYSPFASEPRCYSETIQAKGEFDGQESAQSALFPFFKEIFERCGIPRPDHLPK